jgi:hypothetical protein
LMLCFDCVVGDAAVYIVAVDTNAHRIISMNLYY